MVLTQLLPFFAVNYLLAAVISCRKLLGPLLCLARGLYLELRVIGSLSGLNTGVFLALFKAFAETGVFRLQANRLFVFIFTLRNIHLYFI